MKIPFAKLDYQKKSIVVIKSLKPQVTFIYMQDAILRVSKSFRFARTNVDV